MSYYQYLSRYSPSFLAKYQAGSYAHLQRSTQYADIVNMNATTTLSVDEDVSVNLKAPYTLSNILGFIAVIYWYMYHGNMYQANTIRHRLRSYHNYKMWGRLEFACRKHMQPDTAPYDQMLKDRWLLSAGLTFAELETIQARCGEGEDVHEVLDDMGMVYDKYRRTCLKKPE